MGTEMKKVFEVTESMTSAHTHYCAGCGHGVIHRLMAEVLDEFKVRERVIGVAPVGCAVVAYEYWNFDVSEAPHGRTPVVAAGIKRAKPDAVVFSYQGDGDLAAIGLSEIIHTANRGEKITVVFVNNTVYGMTGGQMAPTTLAGQKTLTTPEGRDTKSMGEPLKICEMLTPLAGVKYVARGSVHDAKSVIQAKKLIRKAFAAQIEGDGFGFVEILSGCPTYWGMTPVQSNKYIADTLTKHFPLAEFKDWSKPAVAGAPAPAAS